MTTRSPAQIGRFQIQAQLGAGAFGTVYRAHDSHLDRAVALKVPHLHTLADPGMVERFLREAKAAAGLHHPHIVPVYAAGRDGDQFYIASAFIEGQTLAHAIENSTLSGRQAACIVRDLAEALAYAHSLGVVHRDVKPANIMLDTAGTAHLMDFGLAHRHEEGSELTQDGTLLGTPAYMAPEQAQGRSGEPLPASDQYSLGVVLYELLTGQTPFSGPPQIVLFNALHKEPPAPRTIKAKVPRDLETICLKALAKRPQDRYASCQELADDLDRWLHGEPIQARSLGVAERLLRWGLRNPALALASAAAALCLVAAAGAASFSAIHAGKLRHRAAEARRAAEERQQAASAARRDAEQAEQDETKARDDVQEQKTKTAAALAEADRVKKEQEQVLQKLKETNAQSRLEQEKLLKAKLAADEAAKKAKDAQRVTQLSLQARCSSNIVFSPDGKQVALGSGSELLVWDPSLDPSLAKRHLPNPAPVTHLAFDRTGTRLAWTLGKDRTVRVGEVATLRVTRTLTGHQGFVNTLAFNPVEPVLLSAGNRHPAETSGLRLWNLSTGKEQLSWSEHRGSVVHVAYSPDGKVIASLDTDGVVKLWNAQTAKGIWTFPVSDRGATALAFSPDGQWLAVVGKRVQVWSMPDVKSDKPARTLEGQRSVAFSPDGRHLATALKSDVVLYDAASGQKVRDFRGDSGDVTGLAFSPDGKRLVSVGTDDKVRLWDVAPTEQPATTPKD